MLVLLNDENQELTNALVILLRDPAPVVYHLDAL
jgi:hypothetical protein